MSRRLSSIGPGVIWLAPTTEWEPSITWLIKLPTGGAPRRLDTFPSPIPISSCSEGTNPSRLFAVRASAFALLTVPSFARTVGPHPWSSHPIRLHQHRVSECLLGNLG